MERDEDVNAYWRRRVIILAAGLVIFGLLAWALSGSGGAKPSAAARQVAVVRVRSANELPDAAYGSMPTTPTASPSPSPSPSVSGSAKVKSKTKAKAKAKAKAKHKRSAAVHPGSACPAGGVVMTLFSQRPSYVPGEQPVFTVYAVSTTATDCVFRFGPGAVRVLVSKHGRTVWDSADCGPAPVQQVRLVRGVPLQMSVTWNRKPQYRCRGWLPGRSDGQFTAIATTGTQTTPPAAFALVR
jgi:hypothetical protein